MTGTRVGAALQATYGASTFVGLAIGHIGSFLYYGVFGTRLRLAPHNDYVLGVGLIVDIADMNSHPMFAVRLKYLFLQKGSSISGPPTWYCTFWELCCFRYPE